MNFFNKISRLFLFLFFTLNLAGVFFVVAKGAQDIIFQDDSSFDDETESCDLSDNDILQNDLLDFDGVRSSGADSQIEYSENPKCFDADIECAIDKILRCNPHGHVGIEIYSTKRGKVIYAKNQNELFIPASNTKLFSSLLALDSLGANYQFETVLMTDGRVRAPVVEGNLYIVGSGDPSFTSGDLKKLIKSLALTGIKSIKGNFCIDNEVFDHEGFAPGTTIDCLGKPWFSLVESIVVDRRAARKEAQGPETQLGAGRLASNSFDVRAYCRNLLNKYGIKVSGKIIFQRISHDKSRQKIVVRHRSRVLSELVQQVLKDSDNLYADCIFKRVGAAKYGFPGTWKKGSNALRNFLHAKVGIPGRQFKVVDGSGLSRYNLVSPHQIVNLLLWAYDQSYFNNFMKILPISGIDGTLRHRMTNVAYKVKAKTGTLGGVSALSGYIKTSNDLLVFSILNNGFISRSANCPACKARIEDAICSRLACS